MDRTRWLALPLCALLFAACGSSSGDKLSKPDLIAKADKICKDAEGKIKKVASPTSQKDYAGIEKYGSAVADEIDSGVSKLKGLTPPDAVKASYEKYLSASQAQIDQARALSDAGKAKDPKKVASVIKDASKSSAEGKAAARKVGLKDCSK